MGLNGFIFKKINENENITEKKILGAIQDLLAKQHSQYSPIWVEMGWIGCAIQQATSKWLPGFYFFLILQFSIIFFNMKPYQQKLTKSFSKFLETRNCQRRGEGGQKKPKTCQPMPRGGIALLVRRSVQLRFLQSKNLVAYNNHPTYG